MADKITETKATCRACGHIYYFGKKDETNFRSAQMHNCGSEADELGKSMMCLGGCLPALFIPSTPKRQVTDPNKCPKCGSRAITKEQVTHIV